MLATPACWSSCSPATAGVALAVDAIKPSPCHYLTEPSNTDDIAAASGRAKGDISVGLTERATSIRALEWEHIHKVLAETDFNIANAARRLGMHRRTLAQRSGEQQIEQAARAEIERDAGTFAQAGGFDILRAFASFGGADCYRLPCNRATFVLDEGLGPLQEKSVGVVSPLSRSAPTGRTLGGGRADMPEARAATDYLGHGHVFFAIGIASALLLP